MNQNDAIRQLEEQLRQKDVAMEEMNHRFRNQLQIISNLLEIQASRSSNQETVEALRQCRSRVGSIAMVQDMLRTGGEATVQMDQYLRTLVAALAAAWKGAAADVAVKVKADAVSLPPARAAVVGLVVTELVTNAFKHAFGGSKGSLGVELGRDGGDIRLTVSDDGVGMPQGVSIEGAANGGLRLVKALVCQLKGHTESAADKGTTVTVTFPE